MVPAPGLAAAPLAPRPWRNEPALPQALQSRRERLARTLRLAAHRRKPHARRHGDGSTPRLGPAESTCCIERLRAANPRPAHRTSLRIAVRVAVSVILSAQATDRSVNLATGRFSRAPDAAGDRRPRPGGLDGYIRTIGLWRMKAKNVVAARVSSSTHGGEVPRNARPSRRCPASAEDRERRAEHGFRRADHRRRYAHLPRRQPHRLAPGARCAGRETLMKVVPEEFRQDAHHWLILHGRYVCMARKPAAARLPDPGPLPCSQENHRRSGALLLRDVEVGQRAFERLGGERDGLGQRRVRMDRSGRCRQASRPSRSRARPPRSGRPRSGRRCRRR